MRLYEYSTTQKLIELVEAGEVRLLNGASRRVLISAATKIVGGYYAGSIEDQAVELLLKTAERIPIP